MNGRLYRLSPTKDKMWNLYRASRVDGPNGSLMGKYQRRGDASKVVAQVAYQPKRTLTRLQTSAVAVFLVKAIVRNARD